MAAPRRTTTKKASNTRRRVRRFDARTHRWTWVWQ